MLVLVSTLLAGCTVGTAVPAGVDATTSNSAQCVNQVGTPAPAHTHANPMVAGNPTNAGLDCLTSGCHAAGGAGSQFQFGGTIYTAVGGTTPASGVTIRVSFGGTVATAVSDMQGNFYSFTSVRFGDSTAADVTSCPTTSAMTNKLTVTSSGGCNSCHVNGADAPPLGLSM
ncbi:MAG: hypothetical protein ACM31C_11980 [Acidobacteriota bacterium]